MSLKRKIFNIFAAVVMVFGSMPITFLNTHAEDEPTGIVPAEENIPKSLKSVKSNSDGTYDITLEIEGVSSQKTDATKANVVVVFDSSGSMNEEETTYAYSENASGRFRLVNGDYIALYRNTSYGCSQMNSDNATTNVYTDWRCRNRFTGTRYTRTEQTGTRLQVAKTAVNVLANELLSQNDPSDDNLKDVVQMAFVDFATSVKTNTTHTTAPSAPTTNLNTFKSWVSATSAGGGTNWEAALNAANNVSFGDNDKTYIIFVSDGNPTFRDSKYATNATDNCYTEGWSTICDEVWGNGRNDNNGWNLGAAQDVATAIIGNTNKEFYTVGAFGDATNMKKLGGTFYDATDQDALEEAFSDIVNKIKMGLSVADLQIEDGITAATSTEIDGAAGNFRYDVPESWGDDWSGATFEGGSVHWNPGEFKTLSNGEKASVTFTVWPSQEAMDCIASLRNNGTCEESDLTKFGLGVNEDGSFRLITNSTATFRFKTATKNESTGETEYSEISVPIDFAEDRDPTNLPETTLRVMKKWLDSMGSQRGDVSKVSIDLYVDRSENPDPERHYTFEYQDSDEWVGKDQNGKDEYTVAPGVMKKLDGTEETAGLEKIAVKIVNVNGTRYAVLEEGHDYEFDGEVVDFSGSTNHYHITKREYHPMIVDDGGIHNVMFNGDGTESSEETATIEEDTLDSLAVENTLNGGILVFKVVENNGKLDRTIGDEYEITISNIKDAEGNLLSHTDETPMRYRIMNCSVAYNENEGGYKENCSPADNTKTEFYNGTFTVKIKADQGILVGDLPTGATFEVSETKPEGYETPSIDYRLVQYNNKGEREILDEEDGSEYVQTIFGNSSAQAVVTNKLESGDLIISKTVTVTSGDLEQAQDQEFSFIINFYKKQGDANPVRTDTETCAAVKHGETCEIKNIPKGWYYEVVEAAKPGFNEGEETTKTGTIAKGDNEVDFENNYAVTPLDPDDAKILVNKAFASGYESFWISSDQFTFVMTGNGETVESAPLTLSGKTAEFVPTITDAGTYTYTITEKTTDESGKSIFRDGVSRLENDADIVVTIEVEDKGDGTLGLVSKTYSKDSKTIYNKYEGDNTYGGVEGELEFTKDLQGRAWKSSDKFDFTIASGTEGAPMPKETTITADKEHQTVGFGKIKFTNQDVGKTYAYTITESFDVPSVEATGSSTGGISLTIAVSYNTETGKIDLTVSDYEDTFTNIYKTTNVSASKVWDDDSDRDGLRENYEGYYVAVKNDEGKYVAYADLALEDKDDYEFTDLPEKNADGEEIDYEIVEASACSGSGDAIKCTEFTGDDDYTVTVDEDGVITNFHEPELYDETGELTVQKIWNDEGNELARPDTVTIELYANGKIVGKPVPISSANEWKYTFTDLYLNEGGEPIEYSVQESAIGETTFGEDESVIVVLSDDGAILGSWTKSVDNDKYEVTNTWKESKDKIIYEGDTQFKIKKVDENYKPLSDVIFAVAGHSDKTTNKNGEITITVPISKTEKEESFEYKISEKEAKEGYDLVGGSATVAISCTSELTDTDTDELINTYTKTCTFSGEGDNAFKWNEEDLTLTVVNNRSLAKSLTIQKTVKGLSPEVLTDLEFTIEGPEDFGEDGKMTLVVSEDCMITGEMIVCKVDGKVPTGKYTVTESNADVEYFELTVTGDNGKEKKAEKNKPVVFEIENKYEVEKVMYFVDKIWEDTHDKDGKRPEKLTINLLANGEVIDTIDMTMKDAYILGDEFEGDYVTGDIWGYVWESLPYMDEYATVIGYTVEEVLESDDYEQTWIGGDEYATTIVNYHELDDPCAKGGCGGVVVPPAAPETGKFTGVRRGQSLGYGYGYGAVDNTWIVATLIVVNALILAGAARFAKRR